MKCNGFPEQSRQQDRRGRGSLLLRVQPRPERETETAGSGNYRSEQGTWGGLSGGAPSTYLTGSIFAGSIFLTHSAPAILSLVAQVGNFRA